MGLCLNAGPFTLSDSCVRDYWTTLTPFFLTFFLSISWFPLPTSSTLEDILDRVAAPFRPFLPLHEAEALRAPECDQNLRISRAEIFEPVQRVRPLVFAILGLLETLAWIIAGSYSLIVEETSAWQVSKSYMMAIIWLYAVIRPSSQPIATPPSDLFVIYCLQLIGGVSMFGGAFFDNGVYGVPLPSGIVIAAYAINVVVILLLLATILGMPLDVPSASVNKADIGHSISPEDYTTLWGWITFSWVRPLIKAGRDTKLNEQDVWELSPTLQSRPVFIKYTEINRKTLLQTLWAENSLDLILDFVLTLVSVGFNYCNPYFLKRILDAIDKEDATPADRSRAYVYAVLMFLTALSKAQADVQHLWFGRRASVRMRSTLMAAIYDKALKRKDYSGIIDKEKQKAEEEQAAPENGVKDTQKKKGGRKKEKDDEDDPRAGANTGKIVNLMAGDAFTVSQLVSGAYFLYGAPFEIIIGGTFLFQLMGFSAFAGFLTLLAGWPLNTYLSKRSVRINKGNLTARDKRMDVLDELIKAVKFIKFFAWEDRWIQRVLDAREGEMKWMIKARLNSIMFSLLWICAPILVSVISFFVYVWLGNVLTIGTAFTAIALFNMIRTPLNVIPSWIVQILQARVSLNRIAVFLSEDEVTAQVSSLKSESNFTFDGDVLGFANASLKWNAVEEQAAKSDSATSPTAQDDDVSITVEGPDEQDHKFELRNISVIFPERQLTIVTGPTASGKTALLMALLGEMTLIEGRIIMRKKPHELDEFGLMHAISFAAQTSWLQHQSIKDNILFGSPYEEARYQEVLECCALNPDLKVLEDGDATEIGVRGVSLSGGQKARVALARAVYARTKYVLLDDPLSAVDSHTARALFEKLLCGPLLANRTVILVTHHVDLVLPGAHYLVRMLDGRVDTQGTIADLRTQGVLEQIKDYEAPSLPENNEEPIVDTVGEPRDPLKVPRKLVADEQREEGAVKWSIYKTYLEASSYSIWAFLLILIVVTQLIGVGEKVWIMIWGEAYKEDSTNMRNWVFFQRSTHPEQQVFDTTHGSHVFVFRPGRFGVDWPDASDHPLFYVGIFALIGALSALVSISASAAQYTGGLRASRVLFKRLLVTIVRATFRFHDTTPQGRMLNRFGKDIQVIDSNLAWTLQAVNVYLASFFSAVLTVAFVFPLFLIPATLIGYIYRELAIGYLNTGRDLRRMESNSRSPIFSDFGEMLDGIVTVRAFSAERRFLDNLHKKIDGSIKMWYSFWMTNRWLLLNYDALGSFAVFLTSVLAIYGVRGGAGLAGLCITSALSFTASVYWSCRMWTQLELDLNSVERVVEYLDLPQEPPYILESSRPPAYWPSSSNNAELVSVENLVIKYAPELPAVLHDVSFSLRPGERVGLLGRTGSGKSTLAMSFLRFVDPAAGRILIDGIDISQIGLHDLRSRLTFIPQDATLFSGTLRDNLDPFNEHDDAVCNDVLSRVQMIVGPRTPSRPGSRSQSRQASRSPSPSPSSASTLQDASSDITEVDAKTTVSLKTRVSAGGANFSHGQRQLVALARALLRRNSIIILDEATSSIDFETDAKIQETIRTEFTGSLVITVAHRLKTIIDYDRLIVLDKGRIVELDTPWNLINKKDGVFRDMCLKSGSFAELEASARRGQPA